MITIDGLIAYKQFLPDNFWMERDSVVRLEEWPGCT